jgi:hypothetical protein
MEEVEELVAVEDVESEESVRVARCLSLWEPVSALLKQHINCKPSVGLDLLCSAVHDCASPLSTSGLDVELERIGLKGSS